MFKRAWNYHFQFSVVKGNSFILSNINVKGLLNIANSQSSILNLKKKPHPSSSVERSTHTHRHTRTRSFYLMSVTHSSADGKVCLHGHFDEVRVSLTARDCASVCCLRLRVGVRLAWAELVKNPVSLTPAFIQTRPVDLTLFLKHHRSNTWEQISPALSRKPRWNSIPSCYKSLHIETFGTKPHGTRMSMSPIGRSANPAGSIYFLSCFILLQVFQGLFWH